MAVGRPASTVAEMLPQGEDRVTSAPWIMTTPSEVTTLGTNGELSTSGWQLWLTTPEKNLVDGDDDGDDVGDGVGDGVGDMVQLSASEPEPEPGPGPEPEPEPVP